MKNVKRSAVAAGLAVGLLAGGAAGAVLGSPGLSGAEETTTTAPDAAAPETTTPESETGSTEHGRLSERLGEALDPLVDGGTIDQAQADAVIDALVDSKVFSGRGHGGRGGAGGHGAGRSVASEAVAAALGMTQDALREALRDGQTLAQIAEANGVDRQTVIDVIVQERTERIQAKVEAGDLTQDEADEKIAALTERVTTLVDEGTTPRRAHRDSTHRSTDDSTTDDGES